ncbi:hypothetical protein LWM68_08995 [Niabella sp. W65]|nr:hypothetical protein [Niabella sp. W65]MCH7362892.1 hypothetical protein [Niabella sp. W65]
MSSYAELINSLFDDYGFDQFLDKEAIEWGVPSNIVEQLDGVRSMLNVYIDRKIKSLVRRDKYYQTPNGCKLLIEPKK